MRDNSSSSAMSNVSGVAAGVATGVAAGVAARAAAGEEKEDRALLGGCEGGGGCRGGARKPCAYGFGGAIKESSALSSLLGTFLGADDPIEGGGASGTSSDSRCSLPLSRHLPCFAS
mmetsp:Transcript_40766/g.112134  ORF Transcript_40766/g.112134 Transcript_40766/m.112134 type:complete len:117 (+) Transcript_40766:80-430(+)